MKRGFIAIVFASLIIITMCSCKGNMDLEHSKTSLNTVKEANKREELTYEIVDYSQYFHNKNGSVVIYNTDDMSYKMYNEKECNKRYSPCSTFKIVTTLMGLENNIISSAYSKMSYNGNVYPFDEWNQDLDLQKAFESSCVWYFKQIVEKVGFKNTEIFLKDIGYGNCDISQWEGSNINPLPELNGFWLESSLQISPKEQVNVLAELLEDGGQVSNNNVEILKEIMFDQNIKDISIYGKTGTGEQNAWFVGLAERNKQRVYFAVHLSDTEQLVSGKDAKEIALNIISNSDIFLNIP